MGYPVNIGEAAQAAGLTAKMIRDCEAVGLIPQASQTENGYRQYSKRDVDVLRFIRQTRSMSFSIEQAEQMRSRWCDPRRESAQAAFSNEHRQRPMPAPKRREAPSILGLAAWSRSLNGGSAAQHA